MTDPARPDGPVQSWRVLALTPLPIDVLERLFGDERAQLVAPAERTQAAVDALIPDVDVVVGDWSHRLRIEAPGPRVALVQMPSVGVDTINLAACADAGVPVANSAGANAVSVAEWCLATTFAVLRKVVDADSAVRRGQWPQTTLGTRDLAGSRVGVIGMGAIGRHVARLFGAVGCPVQYWSRHRHPEAPAVYAELDELLADSDVIVIVIALGPQTRHLLDRDRIALIKPGAVLVNAARGDIVDEPALIEALRAGRLGGAALDVYAHEPLPAASQLRELPGVLLSPHMAGSSAQAVANVIGQTTANLRRAFEGSPVLDVVNGVDPLVRRR